MFRTRELWLVLAVQEAVYFKLMMTENRVKRNIAAITESSHHDFIAQPNTTNTR
jgi:hypothetical protein